MKNISILNKIKYLLICSGFLLISGIIISSGINNAIAKDVAKEGTFLITYDATPELMNRVNELDNNYEFIKPSEVNEFFTVNQCVHAFDLKGRDLGNLRIDQLKFAGAFMTLIDPNQPVCWSNTFNEFNKPLSNKGDKRVADAIRLYYKLNGISLKFNEKFYGVYILNANPSTNLQKVINSLGHPQKLTSWEYLIAAGQGNRCVHAFDENGADIGNVRLEETPDIAVFISFEDTSQSTCK